MVPVLIQPSSATSAEQRSLWAFYGAWQLLDMMGLSYRVWTADECPASELTIDPARGQVCVRCRPCGEEHAGPIAPELRVEFQAESAPDPSGLLGPHKGSLPVIGGLCALPAEGEFDCGRVWCAQDTYADAGPLLRVEEVDDDGWRLTLGAPVFQTVGLYLSRFSWAGNPGFTRFVRYVDVLWSQLEQRWGGVPVVSEYQAMFERLLRACHEKLGLVMATKWYHPAVDGRIRRSGLLLSHDVDSVYKSPEYRGRENQEGNAHWNFPKWQALESEYGLKSAFYLFSPSPEEDYWLEQPAYLVSDPPVLAAARELAEKGWEIAPHELGFRTGEEVAAEVSHFTEVTGVVPPGTRNHYLKHAADSLTYKAAAGLTYDSTWYAEQVQSSLLCGTVLPYGPLNASAGEPVGLWEFAFVVEDGIVMGCYGVDTGRTTEGAVADGARIIDQSIALNGYICLNWHQRTFDRMSIYEGAPENWVGAYRGIIEYYLRHAPDWWSPVPGELADFWSRRQGVEIESFAGRVSVRNGGPRDAGDLVLCIHDPGAPGGRRLVSVPVTAGETLTVDLHG